MAFYAWPVDVDGDLYKSALGRTSRWWHARHRRSRSAEADQVGAFKCRILYPNKAVTINLAAANVRKEGAGFDLPIAMGILGTLGFLGAERQDTSQFLMFGELSLNGAIRPVRGALSVAVCARRHGFQKLVATA